MSRPILHVKIDFFLALMLTVFATQADFTDVSVLPVIVSRLKEEQVEVGFFFSLLIISIIIMIHNTIISMILIQIIMISVTMIHFTKVLITIENENQVGILVNNVGILGPSGGP